MPDNLNDERLLEWFFKYIKAKKDNTLSDYLPKTSIILYFQSPLRNNFDKIYDNFKNKYIYNENKIENVHEVSEQEGMAVVYDYVQSNKWHNFNNIFVILYLHALLYSKVNDPSFGGNFRQETAFISNSNINTTEPSLIPIEIKKLDEEYQEIIKLAQKINNTNDFFAIPFYIEKCIRLKVRLIEIHPFADGNGRVSRALLNIMFKMVNLPPVYVKKKERDLYINNMEKAINDKNYEPIYTFYYSKICDSIIKLSISDKLDEYEEKITKNKVH